MSKIAVVYWSGTGNTEEMAKYVVEGARTAGANVELFTAIEFNEDLLLQFDGIAFGCPSMGAEQLEESEFEPMFAACEAKLKDRRIALFGSYGWGDGEWMREWEQTCLSNGAILVCDSVICNEAPDQEAIELCQGLGKSLVG